MSRVVAAVLFVALASAGCASVSGGHADTAGSAPTLASSVYPDAEIPAADAPGDGRGPAVPQVAGWATTLMPHDDDVTAYDVAGEDKAGAYRLDTGDKVRVFVYAQPSLSRIYTVDQEGFISVPLIGDVRARGQTTRSLAGAIKSELGRTYVRDPHVTVDISQNRPFFILGEVRSAGQYPFVPGMTVEAAVAIAGGFSERADQRKVQITRRTNGLSEKLEAGRDVLVRPGDTIHIRERWF